MRALLLVLLLPCACSSAPPPAREFLDDPGLRQIHNTFLFWQRCGEDGKAWVSAVVSREGRIDAEIPVIEDPATILSLYPKPMRREARSMTLDAGELAKLKELVSAIPGKGLEEPRPPRVVEGGGFDREGRSLPSAEIHLRVGDAPKYVIYEGRGQPGAPAPVEKSPRAEVLAVDAFLRELLKIHFGP
jgi:hypothetical protein